MGPAGSAEADLPAAIPATLRAEGGGSVAADRGQQDARSGRKEGKTRICRHARAILGPITTGAMIRDSSSSPPHGWSGAVEAAEIGMRWRLCRKMSKERADTTRWQGRFRGDAG